MRTFSAIAACLVLAWSAPASAATNVVVFNFQMKSDTPAWRWLEKGLSDRIATDFAQDRGLVVIARDEMQRVAEKMHWLPEMATGDPQRMKELQEQLKIEYLVTGVYSVSGGNIAITGQIVEVEGRKELARKEMKGRAADVLELQRRLSAELLAWFTKKEPAKILQTLPAWTRSIPAAKALYEGMDLYDQGRYGEAWMKFRQASKADTAYMEAQYFIGKMYYFMNRYEHARRAFERFVYLDSTHPRIADAIREYLHTYEKVNTPPETMLGLYADFLRRFYVDKGKYGRYPPWMLENHIWLEGRSAQVMERMGRYEDAIVSASSVADEVRKMSDLNLSTETMGKWLGSNFHLARVTSQDYNQLTGKVVAPPGITDHWPRGCLGGIILRLGPGQSTDRLVYQDPLTVTSQTVGNRTRYIRMMASVFVVGHDGQWLKKLTLFPEIEGDDGRIFAWLNYQSHKDADEWHGGIKTACTDGIVFNDVPRTGTIEAIIDVQPRDQWRDPKLSCRALRAVAEWEDVPPDAGAIDVSCSNASTFYVRVDGRHGRRYAGLVGMLAPGEHRLKIPAGWRPTPYAAYEQTVKVEAGKTTHVNITLPWKPGSPFAGWPSAALIGRDYVDESPSLDVIYTTPALQVDNEAIRVIWSHRGDLYLSQSTDGEHFSKPARLPLPISTAWIERGVQCIRDESGRLVLLFSSDRDARHELRLYASWSRDAENWSNPAMLVDRRIDGYDLIQDDKGRFLLVDGSEWADDLSDRRITILASRDLRQWETLATWALDGGSRGIEICQMSDGTYLLIWGELKKGDDGEYYTVIYESASKDAKAWSRKREITRYKTDAYPVQISAMQVEGRTLIGVFRTDPWMSLTPVVQLLREDGKGGWQKSDEVYGIGSTEAVMAWHPRWGHLFLWTELPDVTLEAFREAGPLLIRGPSVEPFFPAPKAAKKP